MTKEKDTDKKPDKTAVWLGIVKRIAECRKQHMTWNQIAEATGMTAASAQSNWYRRKHLLEEGLEENVQETPEGEKPEETDAPEIPVTADPREPEIQEVHAVTESVMPETPDDQEKEPSDGQAVTQESCEDSQETAVTKGTRLPDVFRMPFWFTTWKGRTPGDILLEAEKNGTLDQSIQAMEDILTFMKENRRFYPRNDTMIPVIAQAIDLAKRGELEQFYMEAARPRQLMARFSHEISTAAKMNLADLILACRSFKADPEPEPELKPAQEKSLVMESVVEAEKKPDTGISDDEPDDAWVRAADAETETEKETGHTGPDQYMVRLLRDVIRYRTHYLVDTENFGTPIIERLVTGLKDTEMIHLFYTDHSPALSYRVTEKLLQRPNQIRLESCITGTANAMDFQLISALGCLLSACDPGKNDFKIISDDRGYDATVAFWTKRGMPVTRITSCSVASSKTPAQAKKKRETDVISTTFQERDAKEQERWVQIMSCHYGNFCKKHHATATTPTVNSRILLLHSDFRTEDFAKDAAGFLLKVPREEILKARQDVYLKFR